ncbi:MAG: GNAT family N-acetyltransferase [Clostridia bacterium]
MTASGIRLETERLIIEPYDHVYLSDYFQEFTDEITKYQYPDTFADIESASKLVSSFVELMEVGKMLELVILSKSGEFFGCIEAIGLDEENPELGLWLKTAAQGKGYGFEALKCIIDYLNLTERYDAYVYEADERNLASLNLAKKFKCKKESYNAVITDSGKELFLRCFIINNF